MEKKIIIGSDSSGFGLKEAVRKHLEEIGYEVTDVGTRSLEEPVQFYDVATNLASAISNKEFDRGIIMCGTGMGVSLIANKYKGVYVGLCESLYAVNRARVFNNANVLGMGGFIVGPEMGVRMVDEFLNTEWKDGVDADTKEVLEKAYEIMESL